VDCLLEIGVKNSGDFVGETARHLVGIIFLNITIIESYNDKTRIWMILNPVKL
jgi:hypothetical protein